MLPLSRPWFRQIALRVLFALMPLGGLAIPVPAAIAASLESKLMPLVRAYKGRVAVAIKHLPSGASFAYRAAEPMPTASLIKFPVMVEAYRQAHAGSIDLGKRLRLRQEDQVPGSGILAAHFSPGAEITLRDAIRLMIAYSDNTATNLVLDQIGIASVAKGMEWLGLPNTKIHSKVYRRDTSVFPERSQRFGLGSTTAEEMVRLYELLYRRQLVSEAACGEMLEHLLCCEDRTKIAALLPRGTKVAHKSGAVGKIRCDAGLVFSPNGPMAMCVLTDGNQDRRWDDDNAAHRLCAEIARQAFEHFNPHVGGVTERAAEVLRLGATGRSVEDLQRTLNARLQPSPELSVDGDFGPATRDAVMRFQKEKGLPASGEVGPATWAAIGTLVTEDPPVPDPDAVNSQTLAKEPADDPDGPPLVTCKAWAVADGRDGRLLWGWNAEAPLHIASTTKIMTAYVVLKLAAQEPALLGQPVVFSELADATRGSTSGIRAGEELPVRELLYGLLLPSGNDAAVALAEHFGNRFAPAARADSPGGPLDRFVAEMNRQAESLGMEHTSFRNPHGLTEPGHQSSAADLAKLAYAALQLPAFRGYVGTRQHACSLRGPGGYRRNVLWKNTNRLLAIEGFGGVKTGTTEEAGACLVSSGRRGEDERIIVVLGASSSDSRYVDARNLFLWAWRQRREKK